LIVDYFITIAGVQYTIHANHLKLPVYTSPQKAYQQFFFEDSQPAYINNFDVYIKEGDGPDINQLNKIFDSNSLWSYHKKEDDYYIVSRFSVHEDPIWIARIQSSKYRITIHCSPGIIKKSENRLMYNPMMYPLDQILMMHFLAWINGVIIHAAGWREKNSGWLFAGKSGAGKSTISNLIVEETGATFLSDDRIAVRKIGQEFKMYGTPWPGDAGYAVNESVPLKGIFFLSKGTQNNINRLTPSDAIARLMPVVSIPWYDREKVELMMDFCDIMMGSIPMYELTFVPDKAAVDMLVSFVDEQ